MPSTLQSLAASLADAALLFRVVDLAGREGEATVELVAHLAELDARRLYLGEGYGSLFAYCVGALRFAEHAAYNRIEAARASRRFPVVLDLLAEGSVNVSTLRLLAPHLRPDNFDSVMALAKGKTKREVETLVARLAPRPDVAASVRRLPARPQPTAERTGPTSASPSVPAVAPESAPTARESFSPAGAVPPVPAPSVRADSPAPSSDSAAAADRSHHRPVIAPLAPDRYRVQFTVSEATHDKLRRVQELLRREIPDGDPGAIFDRALTLLLEDVARKKLAAMSPSREAAARPVHAKAPGPVAEERPPSVSGGPSRRSRHVPAHVKREVWVRDGGRCAFVTRGGRRCGERAFLEFHHREPYALGGEMTTANIAVRCRRHNAYEAERAFGSSGPATRPGASCTHPGGVRPGLGPNISPSCSR